MKSSSRDHTWGPPLGGSGPSNESGFAMAALLVMMSVMAVVLSVALPVWHTQSQREREEELIFRGQQYARALALFQRRLPGAVPTDVDTLVNGHFLRKKYKDPITGDDFQLVHPGDAATAFAPQGQAAGRGLATAPGGAAGTGQPGVSTTTPGGLPPRGSGAAVGVRGGGTFSVSQPGAAGRAFTLNQPGGNTSIAAAVGAGAAGGIIGVVSKSKDTSFRVYNGRTHYNEWVFVATQQSLRAGGPGGAPGGPRGTNQPGIGPRGGAQPPSPVRGGFNPPGGGNVPQQPPFPGTRGPFSGPGPNTPR